MSVVNNYDRSAQQQELIEDQQDLEEPLLIEEYQVEEVQNMIEEVEEVNLD